MLNAAASSEQSYFSQNVHIERKFSNKELKFYQYFHNKTRIYPKIIIIIRNFIFFFVPNEYYFRAKKNISSIRKELQLFKILIIRAENTLIKLIFSLFPDIYIHDVHLEENNQTEMKKVKIMCLSYEERGIAIGCRGDYIKVVNELFKNYITPIKIKCELAVQNQIL